MNIDWAILEMAVPLLAEGTVVTLYISAAAAIISTIIGVAFGLFSLTNIKPLRIFVGIYVDFIRGTPILVQIFLIFFALPVIGIRLDEIWAGIIALSLNTAGYMAETVRGAVGSVEKGQSEAAKSIGMTNSKILVYILLPQAYRTMVPPMTNELITLVKNSSLLSVISVYELTRSAQAIISVHFVPFELFTLLALYYYVIIKTLSWLSRRLERAQPVR